MRIALGIEYIGTIYAGWQKQKFEVKTVQKELETAISFVANQQIEITCAGRTDTGVHGFGQVVHFDSDAIRSDDAWLMGINSNLPKDISVIWVKSVADDFHARFSAISRRYCYINYLSKSPSALLQGKVSYVRQQLDIDAMNVAANYLLGEHDFSAFRSSKCEAKHANRNIKNITLTQNGKLIILDITANAFLHHMVRNIMGSLLIIGEGKPPQWIDEILQGKNRQLAGPTASASGLYLVEVEYDKSYNIPFNNNPFLFYNLRK